jgi:hypothetical protein
MTDKDKIVRQLLLDIQEVHLSALHFPLWQTIVLTY